MNDAKRYWIAILLSVACLPALAVSDMRGGPAVRELGFQPPVTSIATDIWQLHNWMIGICLVIFIAVFGVMLYSVIKHRKSTGHRPASFHESTTVEIAWTVIPFLIIVLMAYPATKTVVAMKDTTNADITIKATGMQWKWGYDYLKGEGEGISLLSALSTPREQVMNAAAKGDNYLLEVDNALVVPVHKKIRIITTANDVIHSWGVPAFAVKQDAIPGFVRDTWFRADHVGEYRGNCYELCGKEHAYMPIHVKVLSAEDYAQWVAGEKKKPVFVIGSGSARLTNEERKARVAELGEAERRLLAGEQVSAAGWMLMLLPALNVALWAMATRLDPDRQFIHDRLARTRIVLAPAAKDPLAKPATD